MDKFNNFIKNKVREEKESFILPKSFEDKIELVLENIDHKKSIKFNPWYKNRKIIAVAACLVLGCVTFIKLFLLYWVSDGYISKSDESSANVRSADGMVSEFSLEMDDGNGALLKNQGMYGMESNITLNLSGDDNQIEVVDGQYILDSGENLASSYLNDDILNNLQFLIVNKNEEIKMNFSEVPSFYQVYLLEENYDKSINSEEVKPKEYPSGNYMIKAPNNSGIYVFEVIGKWGDKEIAYMIRIQVED
jgi:hypothetical protein